MTYLPITNPSEATGNNPKSANSSREIHNRGVEGGASRISTRWWNDFQKLWPGLSGREERVRVKTGYVSRNKHSPRACLPHQEGGGGGFKRGAEFPSTVPSSLNSSSFSSPPLPFLSFLEFLRHESRESRLETTRLFTRLCARISARLSATFSSQNCASKLLVKKRKRRRMKKERERKILIFSETRGTRREARG